MISDTEMLMLEAFSVRDIHSFPANKWGIPEPDTNYFRNTDETAEAEAEEEEIDTADIWLRRDAWEEGLDLLLVPGAAFDTRNNRIGYGRGYYDRYIRKYRESGREMPLLIGIGFREQLLQADDDQRRIPIEAHDQPLDMVLVADDDPADQ